MNVKNISKPDEVALVGTRVTPEVKEKFQHIAASHNRSVAGHLRHLIEKQIDGEPT